MREIKLRGYSVERLCADSQWVEGFGVMTTEYANGTKDYTMFTYYGNYQVYGKSVGQCTGLHDKNGKEIFEGDIVKLEFDGIERIFEVGIETVVREVKSHPSFADKYAKVAITGVVFKWEGFQLFPCVDYQGMSDTERMEIIGNIFENPELLEVAK
ncbi:hypothetical protein FZC84_12020 [Rossellomorea vietnamensis]|uniref:YopX protein domain-containing protein n=1 Tax=Rossellomorea vietnamensis TaxID=218284 RepID=A0A5D4MDK0_9BACI|nr:YopX family protein [Rossellomorea vietnamensis]TYR99095.1 hypothetical protein FZC84_12020 [Rossellomorea vietnamensis]